jgi:hypothetical protein
MRPSRRFLGGFLLLGACLLGAALALPEAGMAKSEGPFASLSGNWHGSGRVTATNGTSERISCRATYTVSPDGINLSQSLVCASDSYRFDIRASVFSDGQSLTGTWQETTRNASGNLTGQIDGGSIETTVSGPGFTAGLSLKTSSHKQVVSIRPQGMEIAKVDITLTR